MSWLDRLAQHIPATHLKEAVLAASSSMAREDLLAMVRSLVNRSSPTALVEVLQSLDGKGPQVAPAVRVASRPSRPERRKEFATGGRRRTKERLNELREGILEIVANSPKGVSIVEIERRLKIGRREGTEPMRSLRKAGLVLIEGTKQNARYFPVLKKA